MIIGYIFFVVMVTTIVAIIAFSIETRRKEEKKMERVLICPKCEKKYSGDWKLCQECGVRLIENENSEFEKQGMIQRKEEEMKTCPSCAKTYDDTWGVCLNCNIKLEESAEITRELTEEEKKIYEDKSEKHRIIKLAEHLKWICWSIPICIVIAFLGIPPGITEYFSEFDLKPVA